MRSRPLCKHVDPGGEIAAVAVEIDDQRERRLVLEMPCGQRLAIGRLQAHALVRDPDVPRRGVLAREREERHARFDHDRGELARRGRAEREPHQNRAHDTWGGRSFSRSQLVRTIARRSLCTHIECSTRDRFCRSVTLPAAGRSRLSPDRAARPAQLHKPQQTRDCEVGPISQDELLEHLGATTADGQGSTTLQGYSIAATSGDFYLQNLIEPHDRGAVHAQELGRV